MSHAHVAHLPVIPDAVPRDALRTVCDVLGLPADDVRALDISPDNVMVVLHARDKQGRKLTAGNDAVVVTVSIPVH